MNRRKQLLVESVVGQDNEIELDEANHIVRNVKVAGMISKNKRRYLESALRGAVQMYEGVKVNVDHPDPPMPGVKAKPRPFASRFGRLESPRWTPTGIRANLNYNPEHEHARTFVWWVKNDPAAVGLSHNILGVAYESEGETVIEKIEEVKSVDLVADPATTQGLLEANEMEMTLGDGHGDDDGDGDECDHLCNAATAIIKNKEMDKATKLSRLKKLLGLMHDDKDKGTPDMPDETPAPAPAPTNDKKLMESSFIDAVELDSLLDELKTLRGEKARVEKKNRVTGMCQEAALPTEALSEVFVESLMVHDDVTIKKLIDDRKAMYRPGVPASVKPVSSAPGVGGAAPDTKSNFLSGFKSLEN